MLTRTRCSLLMLIVFILPISCAGRCRGKEDKRGIVVQLVSPHFGLRISFATTTKMAKLGLFSTACSPSKSVHPSVYLCLRTTSLLHEMGFDALQLRYLLLSLNPYDTIPFRTDSPFLIGLYALFRN